MASVEWTAQKMASVEWTTFVLFLALFFLACVFFSITKCSYSYLDRYMMNRSEERWPLLTTTRDVFDCWSNVCVFSLWREPKNLK